MKAISIKQPFIGWILDGKKTLEIRSWATKIRGDILLCASKLPKLHGVPLGHAVAIANLADCREFLKEDEALACCNYDPEFIDYAWVLKNIRPITPFPVTGKLNFYEVQLPPTLQIYDRPHTCYQ